MWKRRSSSTSLITARLLPNCTLIELPESKHDPFLERDVIRDYWLSCLDRFIAERLVKTAH